MTRRWIRPLFAAAILLNVSAVFFCFGELNSTLSDISGGDCAWTHQIFYNVLHGRPFQTSVYRVDGGGVEDNRFAYAHDFAIQTNLTIYLFAPFYALRQTLGTLYGLIFILNYLGIAFWTWKILTKSKTRDPGRKTLLALSGMLLSCGFFWTIGYQIHPLLFAGPFFFGLYYFLIAGSDAGYYLMLALICLISEDASLFMISWSGYLFLFHPNHRRKAVITGLASAAWVVFCIKLIQPAARHSMMLSSASLVTHGLNMILHPLRPGYVRANLMELLRSIAVFSPMLAASALLFNKKPFRLLAPALGLVLLAPASHWVITLWTGGGEHWMPIMLGLLLLNVVLMCPEDGGKPFPASAADVPKAPAWCLAIFVAVNAAGLHWVPLKNFARRTVLPRVLHYRVEDLAAQAAHNRKVVDYIRTIPKDKSVTFWINQNLTGYVADRSDFWWFPAYFAEADFLVMDRQMPERTYDYSPDGISPTREQEAVLKRLADSDGIFHGAARAGLSDYLVNTTKTYRILVDDQDLLVLRRTDSARIPVPAETLGLGFVKYLAKR
ncbi:MAG: DUF2079 domain-containing protein [Elusimicrobiota bacterium]